MEEKIAINVEAERFEVLGFKVTTTTRTIVYTQCAAEETCLTAILKLLVLLFRFRIKRTFDKIHKHLMHGF